MVKDHQGPSWTRRAWQRWLSFGHCLGNHVGRSIMIGFYFVIAMPFSLGVKLGSDPLQLKRPAAWTPKTQPDDTLDRARRLF